MRGARIGNQNRALPKRLRRSKNLLARVRQNEYNSIRAAARASDMTVSEFIRAALAEKIGRT